MLLLILFAFLAGVVTILSPCILPILPIVLSGSVGTGKRKPLGIVVGFILSFTFFTLTLSTIARLTKLPADFLREISILVVFVFGVSFLIPKLQIWLETIFSRFANVGYGRVDPNAGFWSGVIIGLSLGLVWTPCVGPIIASVITLAASSSVNSATVVITLAYSIGTAIPMLIVMQGGRAIFARVPWLLPNTERIQKGFGVLMILTAVALFFNLDRRFQIFVLNVFPQYGAGLTQLEDNSIVRDQLEKINSGGDIVGQNDSLAPEIIPGGKWFNAEPLTLTSLKGKVILIDFWTYTCINCIRTLPYLKSWDEKYRDKGLVIIGVHTPEFEFEKNPNNVEKAIADFGIKYPVIQDNDYAIWKAYNNHFWPAHYLIDKDGKIRSSHFGEGKYDETEKEIQELLKETGMDVSQTKINNPTYQVSSESPESYLGYGRLERFASPEEVKEDVSVNYTTPSNLGLDKMAYGGGWNIGEERAMPEKGASLSFHFSAKEVYLVMRSKSGNAGQVRVLVDEKLVDNANSGDDVKDGLVSVKDDRLYRLIRLPAEAEHVLKLEFLDANVEGYAFTFG